MRQKTTKDLEGRTNRKLRFTQIHLNELTSQCEPGSGNVFERAHEESFLFHLVGAKDSFLQEINNAYKLELDIWEVNEDSLQRKLEMKKRRSPELNEIMKLEERKKKRENRGSWLSMAIEDRNQGMHRFDIQRFIKKGVGNSRGISSHYINPFTQEPMGITIIEFLTLCINKMEELLWRLRKTLPHEPASESE